jgi:hypothetical protein
LDPKSLQTLKADDNVKLLLEKLQTLVDYFAQVLRDCRSLEPLLMDPVHDTTSQTINDSMKLPSLEMFCKALGFRTSASLSLTELPPGVDESRRRIIAQIWESAQPWNGHQASVENQIQLPDGNWLAQLYAREKHELR